MSSHTDGFGDIVRYCYTASLMPKMLSAKQPGAPVFKEGGSADSDGKPSIALYKEIPQLDMKRSHVC